MNIFDRIESEEREPNRVFSVERKPFGIDKETGEKQAVWIVNGAVGREFFPADQYTEAAAIACYRTGKR